jgi:hypothetical protein
LANNLVSRGKKFVVTGDAHASDMHRDMSKRKKVRSAQ